MPGKAWWKNPPVAANLAPVANSGSDKSITLPTSSTILAGSGTDPDGNSLSYSWSKVSGPVSYAIASPSAASTTVTGLVQGQYRFVLTVTDNKGATDKDTMIATVNPAINLLPVAFAGNDTTLILPVSSMTLHGTGTDVDGTISTYTWSLVSGPSNVAMATPDSANTFVIPLINGTYQFKLIVTDDRGGIAIDYVNIFVDLPPANIPPIANAGSTVSVQLPQVVATLTGGGTDADGTLVSYAWVKISGPDGGNIGDSTLANPLIGNLQAGIYEFQLTVTDDDGGTGTSNVQVSVLAAPNEKPVAKAGSLVTITLPENEAPLSGTLSYDPDGTIAAYAWAKVSGPSGGTIVDSTLDSIVIEGLTAGTYKYSLTVTDDDGATDVDEVTVIVNAAPVFNQIPVVNAGLNQVITLPTSTITVDGLATDSSGNIVSVLWTKISGPTGGTIATPTLRRTIISSLTAGTYMFRLTATDDSSAVVFDEMRVTVNPLQNQIPQVIAGNDVVITLPTNSTTITSFGMDVEGAITYAWTKISGPSGGSISSPTAANTLITGLLEGRYVYEVTVTDLDGATGTDRVEILVNPAVVPNKAPIANAGANQTITLPASTSTLTGSGLDADGTIVGYLWTKIGNSPAAGSITSSTSATTAVTGLVQGVYEFQLRVTDDDGAIHVDVMTITVNGATNVAPTAAAGTDQSITLPVSSVSLTGSGIDTDGNIVGYQWTKISGPTTFTIVSPTLVSTVVNNLVEGVYQFQLRVTDNAGAVGYDVVQITVNPNVSNPTFSGKYTFTIPPGGPYTVSAGVFEKDSFLVRVLFGPEVLNSGTYSRFWNGKDRLNGTIAFPDPNYKIKIRFHKLRYEWQGTIGNRADFLTGDTKHHGYYRTASNIVVVGDYIYYVTGYSEGYPSFAKAHLSKPHQKVNIYGKMDTGDLNYLASDGTYIYVTGFDPKVGGNTFVFAIRADDNTEVQFTGGSKFESTYGRDYPYAIGITTARSGSKATGIAVQKTGNYMFLARGGVNELAWFNKLTGVAAGIATHTAVRFLACEAGTNALWMVTGTNTVTKHTVDPTNGTLSAPILTLSGLSDPQALQVRPDGTQIAIADGGSSQQVKFFNTSTGALIKAVGVLGGYNGSTLVADNKFYFTDVNGRNASQFLMTSSIAFQSDNSYWVLDPGNDRIQHFNSADVYVQNMAWNGAMYFAYIDRVAPTRLFSKHFEYKIDYSRPLSDSLSWTLYRNHGYNSNVTVHERYPGFHKVFPNGKTFTLHRGMGQAYTNKYEIKELTDTGYRSTGRRTTNLSCMIADDNSLQEYIRTGDVATVKRYPLQSYDALGTPIWSTTGETLAIVNSSDSVIGSPFIGFTSQVFSSATNRVVFFSNKGTADLDAHDDPIPDEIEWHKGAHLGIVSRGSNKQTLALTEWSTHRQYGGLYPGPTWFDIGNMVNDYAGGSMILLDRNIITSYHGEFWKNGQTNQYNHHYDDGLPMGQFGTNRSIIPGNQRAVAEMAGNALRPVGFRTGDTVYMYHGDESDHNAIHRWKITGFETIQEQTVSMAFPSAYADSALGYTDLMAGIPFNEPLRNNVAGWTRNPINDTLTDRYNNYWVVKTRTNTYDPTTTGDVYVEYALSAYSGNRSINRVLDPTGITSSWKISAQVTMGGEANTNNVYGSLRVQDATGKVLASFYQNQLYSGGVYTTNYYGNGKLIGGGRRGDLFDSSRRLQPLEITYNAAGSTVTFRYASYPPVTTALADLTANPLLPSSLQVTITSVKWGGAMSGKTFGIAAGRFYKNPL